MGEGAWRLTLIVYVCVCVCVLEGSDALKVLSFVDHDKNVIPKKCAGMSNDVSNRLGRI